MREEKNWGKIRLYTTNSGENKFFTVFPSGRKGGQGKRVEGADLVEQWGGRNFG